MRIIHFFRGLPASGKSTEAEAMLKQFPNRYKRVNKDSIRSMFIGPDFNFKTENMVVKIRDYALEMALRKGYDVIVDDTNLKEKYYLAVCAIAKRVGDVQIVERYFECPLDECLRRNKNRPNPVPEDLIIRMYENSIKGKIVSQRTEYFPPVVKEFKTNPALPSAIISDIDGTLSLNENGRSYYDSTRVIEDNINTPIADIVKLYKKNGVKILILSGREDASKKDTETWLKCNDIDYDALYMRTTGDHRGDEITKRELYDKYIKDTYNVLFVLDDREKVVDLWRELGLTCLQVNYGNF